MPDIQTMPQIKFDPVKLKSWGDTWLGTHSSTGGLKKAYCFDKKQGMDFGKEIDSEIGTALATMLGDIPVCKPLSSNALLPPNSNCVEVGDTRIIGGIRPQNYDIAYRPDGVRIAYDSKTLNDASSIKKNWQNMINDIAAEASTLHTRFRYALALFVVLVPKDALSDSQAAGLVNTLERMNERIGVDEENHKSESISLIVWDPHTGKIDPLVPSESSSLRIEKFSSRIEQVYRSRYKGLPPH